jgi:hypothetical protein
MAEYKNWLELPTNLKTKKKWLRSERRVQKGAFPLAHVVYEQIDDDTGEISVTSRVPLYDIAQTVPYKPSPRTKAYWEYEKIFFENARKDVWIHKTDITTGLELKSWVTEKELDEYLPYHLRNKLTSELIQKHVNQNQIIGIKSLETTRFILIDLDLHGKNFDVFEEQAKVLLEKFNGKDAWHCQVHESEVNGIHFIRVFDRNEMLDYEVARLRKMLQRLDSENPALRERAKSHGMSTLGELEIYPTRNGNGVRLPLSRGRKVFLDRELKLLPYKGKMVQDVVGYIDWLNDPERQYMKTEKILGYLHYFRDFTLKSEKTVSDSKFFKDKEIISKGWKGNMRKILREFWLDGNANGISLNEHIIVLCRLAAQFGHTESHIISGVNDMIISLPESAKIVSGRLIGGDYEKIFKVVATSASNAFYENGHQSDSERSTRILQSVFLKLRDFDPLDIKTWTKKVEPVSVVPVWTNEQKETLFPQFRKVLFVKSDDIVTDFLNKIIVLTLNKEKQESGWGKDYLKVWMEDEFPMIKCAKPLKRHKIIKCLQDFGIIKVVIKGVKHRFATYWKLGYQSQIAIGVEDVSDFVTSESLSLS